MELKINVRAGICVFVFLACIFEAQSAVFDVTKFGAVAGGKTDTSNAVLSAWKEACQSKSPSKVVIPKGVYLLGPIKMSGPCAAAIEVQVQGTLKAPVAIEGDSWVTFGYVDQLTLSGGGTFDGQGQAAWKANDCNKNTHCKSLAINLRFNFIKNGVVSDVRTLNSKNFHVNVLGCENLRFNHFKVIAPKTSINTDGIHIGRSTGINITDTTIATGDDCISIGDGARQVRITKVKCGPGHGISIGSLGKFPNEEPVSGIFVTHSNLSNTDNGVRIKTWPGLYGGSVSDMHFEDITMDNVSNPIIIDQVYCPWNQCNRKAASKVKINNVSFKNIRGTSSTPVAVNLACSSSIPCEDVEISDINLEYTGHISTATSQCTNVKPVIKGTFKPSGC